MTIRRKLWLAVAVLAVAFFAMSPIVGAAHTPAHLVALSKTAVPGTTTPLGVIVAPTLVGGTGDLFATTEDGTTIRLGSFDLRRVAFVLPAPVPANAGEAGETLTYYFETYDGVGGETTIVSNGAVVLLEGGQGTEEPPEWD